MWHRMRSFLHAENIEIRRLPECCCPNCLSLTCCYDTRTYVAKTCQWYEAEGYQSIPNGFVLMCNNKRVSGFFVYVSSGRVFSISNNYQLQPDRGAPGKSL